jgi:hypothetical protein
MTLNKKLNIDKLEQRSRYQILFNFTTTALSALALATIPLFSISASRYHNKDQARIQQAKQEYQEFEIDSGFNWKSARFVDQGQEFTCEWERKKINHPEFMITQVTVDGRPLTLNDNTDRICNDAYNSFDRNENHPTRLYRLISGE